MLNWVKDRIKNHWCSEVVNGSCSGRHHFPYWHEYRFTVKDGREGVVMYDPTKGENGSITIQQIIPEKPDFKAPYRVGRNQSRAILDARGLEVVLLRKGLEGMAAKICRLLNDDAEKSA